jgi:hypothetical protein
VGYKELKMSLQTVESAKQSLTRKCEDPYVFPAYVILADARIHTVRFDDGIKCMGSPSENDIHNGIVVSSVCVFAIATLERY